MLSVGCLVIADADDPFLQGHLPYSYPAAGWRSWRQISAAATVVAVRDSFVLSCANRVAEMLLTADC